MNAGCLSVYLDLLNFSKGCFVVFKVLVLHFFVNDLMVMDSGMLNVLVCRTTWPFWPLLLSQRGRFHLSQSPLLQGTRRWMCAFSALSLCGRGAPVFGLLHQVAVQTA